MKSSRKELYVNGDKVNSLSSYIGKLLCVGFSPGDLALVQGSPQERRRFLDRHMTELNPSYMDVLMEYHRALKNKLKVLKSTGITPRELQPWNEILAEKMVTIIARRHRFLQQLSEISNRYHGLYSLNDGELSLQLRSSVCSAAELPDANTLFEKLSHISEKEILLKSSLAGTHRDEVVIRIGGHDARAYASQGQARSIVLSLKLAVIELLEKQYDESPVIVLDDVDSELDERRSGAFFDLILSQGRQVFITGTDLRHTILPGSDSSIWRIEDGSIAAQKQSDLKIA